MQLDRFDSTIAIEKSVVAVPADEVRAGVSEYCRGERRTFDLRVVAPDGVLGEVMGAVGDIR